MKRLLAITLGRVATTLAVPAVSRAADPCPAEVTEVKAALTSAQASVKSQKVQAPRGQQDIQARASRRLPSWCVRPRQPATRAT